MNRRRSVALTAALLLLAPPTSALAATCPRTSLPDVEDEVMCLVCGVPLALADAPQAQRERVFITRMVRQCRSKDQIESALVAHPAVAEAAVIAVSDELTGQSVVAYVTLCAGVPARGQPGGG